MLSQYEDPNNRPAPFPVGARGVDPLNTDVAAPALPARPFVMHYWKEGPARLLSHLNVMQLMERAMIRSEFPLRFTEGFNPHPKFATSPAIPLGMSSHSEYIQFELEANCRKTVLLA